MGGIPDELLKSLVLVALEAFHNILVSIWDEEDMLKVFRDATVISLFKSKGSTADCSNYRGIFLVVMAGEISARVILNPLITNISEENLLKHSAVSVHVAALLT